MINKRQAVILSNHGYNFNQNNFFFKSSTLYIDVEENKVKYTGYISVTIFVELDETYSFEINCKPMNLYNKRIKLINQIQDKLIKEYKTLLKM